MRDVHTWEQPGFSDGLDAVAVDLITAQVQRVFAALDPAVLVAREAPQLDPESRRVVADLIDSAVVGVDVDFSRSVHWRP